MTIKCDQCQVLTSPQYLAYLVDKTSRGHVWCPMCLWRKMEEGLLPGDTPVFHLKYFGFTGTNNLSWEGSGSS